MKIAVVGGGISGLACAWRLHHRGHAVQVFESATRMGGRMSTEMVRGLAVDLGVNVLLENYTHTRALAAELGVAQDFQALVVPSGGILKDHELAAFETDSLWDVLRFKGVSMASRVQLMRFFLRSFRNESHLDFFDLSAGSAEVDDGDAHSVLSREVGPEVAEHLVDTFARTFHFHSARKMSVKYFRALASLLVQERGFATHAFKGHMHELPNALAAHLQVHRGVAVEQVRAGGIRTKGHWHGFDAVVLATPAPTALALLAHPTSAQASTLQSVQYSCTVSAAFEVPRRVAKEFEGIWVPFSESAMISECSNETCKGSADKERCVFNVGLHEEAAQHLLALPDAALFDLIQTEWCRMFPEYRGHLNGLHIQRWPHALPVYGPGQVTRVAKFWAGGQGEDGIYFTGDWMNHPWVEGSIRCGEKVAGLVDVLKR